jgi:hypothetical protein
MSLSFAADASMDALDLAPSDEYCRELCKDAFHDGDGMADPLDPCHDWVKRRAVFSLS